MLDLEVYQLLVNTKNSYCKKKKKKEFLIMWLYTTVSRPSYMKAFKTLTYTGERN